MIYILIICSGQFAAMVNGQIETRRLSNENFRLANVDSLTDLPNRRQFFHRPSVLAEQARTANHRFVVGVLDLDGFKAVNDLYGHGVGDRVLKETGQRLLGFPTTRNSSRVSAATSSGSSSDAGLDPEAFLRSAQKSAPPSTRRFPSPGSSPRSAARSALHLRPMPARRPGTALRARRLRALPRQGEIPRPAGDLLPGARSRNPQAQPASNTPCGGSISTPNCRCTFSRSSMSRTARRSASKRSRDGIIPSSVDVAPDVFISVAERTEMIGRSTQVRCARRWRRPAMPGRRCACPSICRRTISPRPRGFSAS